MGKKRKQFKTMKPETKQRDTYKYHVKIGNKIAYRGVTKNLERRATQHKARWPNSHVVQIGKRTTIEKALEWERRGGKK